MLLRVDAHSGSAFFAWLVSTYAAHIYAHGLHLLHFDAHLDGTHSQAVCLFPCLLLLLPLAAMCAACCCLLLPLLLLQVLLPRVSACRQSKALQPLQVPAAHAGCLCRCYKGLRKCPASSQPAACCRGGCITTSSSSSTAAVKKPDEQPAAIQQAVAAASAAVQAARPAG